MGRCFVFAAAGLYGLRERPAPGDFVIAADAGYQHCRAAGIAPNLLLGDFDSMPYPGDAENAPNAPDSHMPDTENALFSFPHIERVPVEKDDTDTMLALKAGLSRGCDCFYIYGASGGERLDHFIANLQGLLYLRRHGAHGYLYGKNFIWTVIENENIKIRREMENGLLSVFAWGGRAEGVYISGVQYPLTDAVLIPEFPLGVSNHILEETADIHVRKGALLVGWRIADITS